MANWYIHRREKGAKDYTVTITVFVKAKTEEEAEDFVEDKLHDVIEGSYGIYADKTPKD